MEVSVHRKSYSTQLVDMEDNNVKENVTLDKYGGFLKPNVFTLTIPQVSDIYSLCILKVIDF